MKPPIWVFPEVVNAVQQILLAEHGGLVGIRDEAMLESALARPHQRFTYDEQTSIFELAAAYSYGLAKNHPFLDGNKRIALTVAGIFLEINGYVLDAPEADTVVMFEQLAAGEINEQVLADWLRDSSIKTQPEEG